MKSEEKIFDFIVTEDFHAEKEDFLLTSDMDLLYEKQFTDAYYDGYEDGFYYGQMVGERSIFDRIINPYASMCLAAAVSILQENGVCSSVDAFKVLNENNSIIMEKTRKFLKDRVEPLLH